MNFVLLTQDDGIIIGNIAKLLGLLMNAIFYVIDSIGLPNIGLAIILFTIAVNLLMLPLNIRQQKFSKLQAKMNPEISFLGKLRFGNAGKAVYTVKPLDKGIQSDTVFFCRLTENHEFYRLHPFL